MAAWLLPGGPEIWIILGVVVLIFGPTQIPKLAKMIGKSAKSLKDGIDGKLGDDEDEAKPAKSDDAPETPSPAPKDESSEV
jgi:sec-independent protein translocase protein TatA